MGTQIRVGDTRVFLANKCQQHRLSQNIGPAIDGSAGPVPPALLSTYTPYACVKQNVQTNKHYEAKMYKAVEQINLFWAVSGILWCIVALRY